MECYCLDKYHSRLSQQTATHLKDIASALSGSGFLEEDVYVQIMGRAERGDHEGAAESILEQVKKKVRNAETFCTFAVILASTGDKDLAESLVKDYWSGESSNQTESESVPSYQMDPHSDFVIQPQENLPHQLDPHLDSPQPDPEVRPNDIHLDDKNRPLSFGATTAGTAQPSEDLPLYGQQPPKSSATPHQGRIVLPSCNLLSYGSTVNGEADEASALVSLYGTVSKTLTRAKQRASLSSEAGPSDNSTEQQRCQDTFEMIEGMKKYYEKEYKLLEKELKLADSSHKLEMEYVEKKHKRTVLDILARQKRKDIKIEGLRRDYDEQERALTCFQAAYNKKCEELQSLNEELKEIKDREASVCRQIDDRKKELQKLTLTQITQRKLDIEVLLDDLKAMEKCVTELQSDGMVSAEEIDRHLENIEEKISLIKERRNSQSWPKTH